MTTPSFLEDDISKLPALELLMKLGYTYLSPVQALEARGGRRGNVLLEGILKQQLARINSIRYKDKDYAFSEANITTAILGLRNLPEQEGYISANKAFYELLTLGRSLEQNIEGNKKSFSFRYIDWERPENNVFHVTEEYKVLRSGRNDTYVPDLVLFINGIPTVVIECKRPSVKYPTEKAIEQHLRNQQEDGIRPLYHYSSLLLALATHEARYATTATPKEYWSVWKEIFRHQEQETAYLQTLTALKNEPLPQESYEAWAGIRQREETLLHYQQGTGAERMITEQDKAVYSLCRPGRLLDLIRNFTLYENSSEKKIARYQQYFAVRGTLERVSTTGTGGRRRGGVIWHTQGSGKSLTMVLLGQLIAADKRIPNPKILLVTDRTDLDSQITDTFQKCEKEVVNAKKGISAEAQKKLRGEPLSQEEALRLQRDTSLAGLLMREGDAVITTVINKFESAVNQMQEGLSSPDIFVLIDEGHRSQYGSFHVKMRKAFPNACFIAFTGTPLMKKEKNTALKFGGIIQPVYTILDAVRDGAVVPLLYEGRHHRLDVNEKPLDSYFEKISEPLTDYGRNALKKKHSTVNSINKADEVIYARAWDISEHYEANFKGTGLKGQLVAPNKASAVRYKKYLDEIGKVSSEVVMSPPDEREGEEDVYQSTEDIVLKFWKARMDKHGNPEKYEEDIINDFKKQDKPEIIIVVDKLLTGFDAPRNTVMYLTRQLREHTLLQAIARVNRVFPGKEYGYIIDYFGNLENLDNAIETYSALKDFDEADLQGTITKMTEEISQLPQAHSELWDIFKELKNKYDEPAYEELLSDEAIRYLFYEKLSRYTMLLKLALSNVEFVTSTPDKQIEKYKSDAKFFLHLRISVKRRFYDDIDYREYEPQVQKLIDKHITAEAEALRLTELVDIFDKEKREAEIEKQNGDAAKADYIASRTVRGTEVKMNEDPVFYKKLATLIKETIADYHQKRINEAEYLKRITILKEEFENGRGKNLPANIADNDIAISIYHLAAEILKDALPAKNSGPDVAAMIAEGLEAELRRHLYEDGKLLVDWQKKQDVEGQIRNALDDLLFDHKRDHGLEWASEKNDELIEECLNIARTKYIS